MDDHYDPRDPYNHWDEARRSQAETKSIGEDLQQQQGERAQQPPPEPRTRGGSKLKSKKKGQNPKAEGGRRVGGGGGRGVDAGGELAERLGPTGQDVLRAESNLNLPQLKEGDAMEVEHVDPPSSPISTEREKKRLDTKQSPPPKPAAQKSPSKAAPPISSSSNPEAKAYAARVSTSPPAETKELSHLSIAVTHATEEGKRVMGGTWTNEGLAAFAKDSAGACGFGDWSDELDGGSFGLDLTRLERDNGGKKRGDEVTTDFMDSLADGFLGVTQGRDAAVEAGLQEVDAAISDFRRLNVGEVEGEGVGRPSAATLMEESRTTDQQRRKWQDSNQQKLRAAVKTLFSKSGCPEHLMNQIDNLLFVLRHENGREAQESEQFRALDEDFQQYFAKEFTGVEYNEETFEDEVEEENQDEEFGEESDGELL